VRDAARVREAARGVSVIIHAAAMKHITHCESHPGEAYRTNVLGSENVIRAARECGTKVVFISTDKAVAPANLYGATKMLMEGLFQSSGIKCAGVRYGNVLSSAGSVVPFFRERAKAGKVLPITDTRMTRFLITATEAVDLVMLALRSYNAGEILVPRPRSARIADIAEIFCERYGVGTEIVGTRPGEKLYEVLLSERDLPYCIDEGTRVVVKAPGGGFACTHRVKTVDPSVFRSDGPLMSRGEVEALLMREGEL
jgi:UDP-N-acetylglucosamine 4,6-dehydratase